MTAQEIRANMPTGEEWMVDRSYWLREIAAQLADLNEAIRDLRIVMTFPTTVELRHFDPPREDRP